MNPSTPSNNSSFPPTPKTGYGSLVSGPGAPPLVDEPGSFDTEAWFATPELRASSRGMLLEVSVSWKEALLDIAHFHQPRRLTFGPDPRADFCYSLASSMDPPHNMSLFPLIEASRSGEYLLSFDPDMDGVIEENGEQFTLLDLVKAGRAHSFDRTGLCFYPLQPGATVKLSCQENIAIQIRFVSAPPVSKTWFRYLDTHAPVLSFSILIHLLLTCLAIVSVVSPGPSPKTTTTTPPATTASLQAGTSDQAPQRLPPTTLSTFDEDNPSRLLAPAVIHLDPIRFCRNKNQPASQKTNPSPHANGASPVKECSPTPTLEH